MKENTFPALLLAGALCLSGTLTSCDKDDDIVKKKSVPGVSPDAPALALERDELRLNLGKSRKIALKNAVNALQIHTQGAAVKAVAERDSLLVTPSEQGESQIVVRDTKTQQQAVLKVFTAPEATEIYEGVIIKDSVVVSWPAALIPDDEVVVLEEGIKGIAPNAFSGAPVTSLYLPSTLKTIGDEAFSYCNHLHDVTFSEGIERIEGDAFYQCHALEKVALPKSLRSVGENAFAYCDALQEVTISEGLKTLGERAFLGCTALERVTLPTTLTSLPGYAFQGCTALPSVTVPVGVRSIGANAFQGCEALTGVALPATLTDIGRYAFNNCKALASVTLPAALVIVQSYAFAGCEALREVVCQAKTPTVAERFAFRYTPKGKRLLVPAGKKAAYAAWTAHDFTEIVENVK